MFFIFDINFALININLMPSKFFIGGENRFHKVVYNYNVFQVKRDSQNWQFDFSDICTNLLEFQLSLKKPTNLISFVHGNK